MEYWYEFWIANFVVTSIGFALISMAVLVGGIKDHESDVLCAPKKPREQA